jgi:cyanate permease
MKKADNIFLVLTTTLILLALFFVNDFLRAVKGIFSQSIITTIVTLALLLIISIFFFFYKYHFKKIRVFYQVVTLLFFVGYFGFIFFPLGAYDFFEGMIIGIIYTIGKYGSFILGMFMFFNRPKSIANLDQNTVL